MLMTLKAGGDFRADKVAEVKSQIEAGTYADDDHKLDAAIDRMMDDLMK
jgi:anti-sigma28 factor (negative regulator of flagellin synthesis)